jgi:nucleolar protein 58
MAFSLQLRPINKKLGINVFSDIDTLELFRDIRSKLTALLNGLDPKDLATMSLGLSHSLSRSVAVYQMLYEWSLKLD